ncbi:MAG: flagellar biosynthesis protein FlhF [Thermochromatium sp.]
MQDALRQVREQQGPDAVILSSRRVDGLLEVVAATESPAESNIPARPGVGSRAPRPVAATDSDLAAMRRELRDLRALLAQQQALSERDQWAIRHPLAAGIFDRLIACGFDESLARSLIGGIQEDQPAEHAWSRLQTRLAASIATVPPTVLERGGILALVGPTGAGKTTTLSRLTLHRIRRFGTDSVTLVTLDRQRIGAHRQLQAFGQMAGVPVLLLENERDLIGLANRTAQDHLILVDTEGRSARDAAERRLFAQIRHLVEIESWLVIPATHQAGVLRQVVKAFQGCEPSALVLTKIDEAERLGEILSVLLEQQLGLVFQSDGQRLEEDFHKADTAYLTRLALGEPSPKLQSPTEREPVGATLESPGSSACDTAGLAWCEPLTRLVIPKTPDSSVRMMAAAPSIATRDSLVLESVIPFRKSAHAAY